MTDVASTDVVLFGCMCLSASAVAGKPDRGAITSVRPLHITHTHRHTHSGLCNGPTYVALALWLNSPPCKWSGVEWNGRLGQGRCKQISGDPSGWKTNYYVMA